MALVYILSFVVASVKLALAPGCLREILTEGTVYRLSWRSAPT